MGAAPSATVLVEPSADLRFHLGREGAKVRLWQQSQHLNGQGKRLVIAVQAREALLGGIVREHLLGGQAGEALLVGTPPPNLHSAEFRQANADVLNLLLPILRNYARSLPPDAQHLFGGIILGTEISVGVNHYIYPNGNAYINQSSAWDPGLPLAAGCSGGLVTCSNGQTKSYNHWQCPPDFATEGLSGHMWQQGFRAASEMGLPLGSGGTMTRQALDAIVTDYLSFLNHQVRVVNDMPTHKIFSHAGGTWGGSQGPHSLAVARFGSMIPGWSLYGGQATNPAGILDPEVATPAHVALPWATPEWLPFGAGASETNWRNAFPSFSPIDVQNEQVDGYQTSTRGGLQPGSTYYARVVHPDPKVGVAYSNTLAFTVASP